jgi:RHS repeat-associated protein
VLDRSSDGSQVDYLNGLGIDNVLRQQGQSGAPLYFASGHLGSTVALTNASGDVVEYMNYEAFGESTGSSLTRYGFTGRERDNATGLIYYRARWYDPQIGRFISEDPIGFGGGDLNLYAYAWQNPLNFRDPFGLDGWGNDVANWLDQKIDVAQQYWQYNDQEWVANGINKTIGDVSHGVADLFRVGSGTGDAIYGDDNGYGRAANIAMDISRASAIFGILGGGAVGGGRPGGGSGNSPTACPTTPGGGRPPGAGTRGTSPARPGGGFPDRPLPRDPHGRPMPESPHPHTQLGTKTSKSSGNKYPQAREFGENGKHVRDVDFTNHGRADHVNPHQHVIDPVTGKRGPATPLPR